MRNPPPEVCWNIPIPYTVFLELGRYMEQTAFNGKIGDFAAGALRQWLAEQKRARPAPPGLRRPASGYQWKRLFLPDGTLVRTIFKGRTFVAGVEEGRLVHEGQAMSAHDFANLPGGARRNAWNTLWLLLPDARDWKLAADCRPARPAT